MIKMEGAEMYRMAPGEKMDIKGTATGFYIYRDMMGRAVIEQFDVEQGATRTIVGSEPVKPFLLIVWKFPTTTEKEE